MEPLYKGTLENGGGFYITSQWDLEGCLACNRLTCEDTASRGDFPHDEREGINVYLFE